MTTALYNAILIRYDGGHVYLDRSGSAATREVYAELGQIADRDLVEQFGNRLLDSAAATRTSDAIEGTVLTDDQVPTLGYNLGDLVDGRRLHAYTATLTPEGYASIVPELDDPWDLRDAALARRIARSSPGLTTEYARPAITRQNKGGSTDTTPPEFSLDGPLTVSSSPAWRATRPWWCAWLDVNIETPGTTQTRVAVARPTSSGTWLSIATAVVPAGQRRGLARVNQGWTPGQRLIMVIPEAGDGAAKLTASLRGVMV